MLELFILGLCLGQWECNVAPQAYLATNPLWVQLWQERVDNYQKSLEQYMGTSYVIIPITTYTIQVLQNKSAKIPLGYGINIEMGWQKQINYEIGVHYSW